MGSCVSYCKDYPLALVPYENLVKRKQDANDYKGEIHFARFGKITDGDTAVVYFIDSQGKEVYRSLRFYGFNTPEKNPDRNLPEKEREKEKVKAREAKQILKDYIKDKLTLVKFHKKGKYGRLIGEVYVVGSLRKYNKKRKLPNINKIRNNHELLKKYHSVEYYMINITKVAKPYYGGKR